MATKSTRSKTLFVLLGLSMLVVFGAAVTQASGVGEREEEREYDGHGREHEREHGRERDDEHLRFSATNPSWQTECSACHIAYPPALLPADAWREMMLTLDDHFGTDASLDEESIKAILPFLEKNAASKRRAESTPEGKPVLRITETRWFKHEHDEISPSVWKRPSINSASNCMACHTAADKGDFSEDVVRIPR